MSDRVMRLEDDQRRLLGRKESASDLQSRLKTRKLLGVGESNGTVYKSKISQLLGINESLCQSFPRGLCYWETLNTLYFFLAGFLCVLLPRVGSLLDLGFSASSPEFCAAIRFYGIMLLSFAAILRCILTRTENREDVAIVLLILSFLTSAQIFVFLCINGLSSFFHIFLRLSLLGGHLGYHYCLDPEVRILRYFSHACSDLAERLSSLAASPTQQRPLSAMDKDK
ncbi:hypothetical protein PFISCL1PPCAC_28208 [Pristionchus fissidentatus]|uniref:Tumor protein p53-inducible protein 11 n=1 Tax=Pristionchus fissidentatus TaxID=1538716 RepID=A0AAV5WXW7_9BILA|nr:hypothetical protein PFISCL1PPCAC_28208 [Pristionchus fissidentatus]